MATVPTGRMERELRALYLRWLSGLPAAQDLTAYVLLFEEQSRELIGRLGGRVASLGALGDFPASKYLDLSPVAGVVYNQMEQAAIQAGLIAGMASTDTARQLLHLGLEKGFNRLKRLARTETTNAYWQNTFRSVEQLPDIVLLWSSETGPRTCKWCIERDGLVVEDPNIRDHPNGRCTLVATTRSLFKYRGTLRADGSIFMDPKWGGSGVAKIPDISGKPRAAAPGVIPAAPIQGAT